MNNSIFILNISISIWQLLFDILTLETVKTKHDLKKNSWNIKQGSFWILHTQVTELNIFLIRIRTQSHLENFLE